MIDTRQEIVILDGQMLAWVQTLIRENRVHEFYVSPPWRKLRKDVLEKQKWNCQYCKRKGKYSRANHVHHVNYLRNRPELALSEWYMADDGTIQRQLESCCKDCHETVCHPERLRWNKRKLLTKERW